MIELEVERGALLAREVEAGRLRHGLRRRHRPQALLQRLALDQLEVRALVAQRVQDRLAERHLLAQGGHIGFRFILKNQYYLRGTVADRPKKRVQADGGDVEYLERNGARRQALAAAHGAPSHGLQRATARLGVVEHDAGVAPAGVAIDAEQRFQALADFFHAGVAVGHGARGADGGTAAAAGAQVRLDLHVVAVGADSAGRAHVEAAVAAGDARAAVRADALLVAEEARLLEFADELRELRRRERLLQRIGARREIALRQVGRAQERLGREVEHEIERFFSQNIR